MKNEIVYDYLCNAIFNGELKPGERIIIRKIGQQLEVSDIPVREAIKMMVAVGLVDSTPHAGAVVKDISIEDRKEMLMILTELQCLAAVNAVDWITDKELRSMENIVEKANRLIKKGSYHKYIELNREFHLLIVKATPFRILENMMLGLYMKTDSVTDVFFRSESEIIDSNDQHKNIIDALRKKDKSKLTRMIKNHMDRNWKKS